MVFETELEQCGKQCFKLCWKHGPTTKVGLWGPQLICQIDQVFYVHKLDACVCIHV